MTESTRTILTWILGVGVVVAGGKVVYDLVKAPPAPTAETATSTPSASASASASGDVDELGLPVPRPKSSNKAHEPDEAEPTEAPSGSASAMASGSSSANAGAQLPELLAAIAKDPKGHEPKQVARSPEGLILLIYEIPGLDQAILALVPNDPNAWIWQLETDAPIDQLTGAKKTEKSAPPRPGATAVKIVSGPFDGAIGITSSERPKLRVIKSPGFQQLENEQIQQQQQQGGAQKGAGAGTKHGF